MKLQALILVLLCAVGSVTAQTTTTSSSEETEPRGKAIIRIFTNFHTGFGTVNDRRGFELDRSYLGYEYKLGHGLKMKAVMDVGKSSDVDDYQRIAYVKNAQVTWNYKKLTLNGGLISTTQFDLQEKFWGHRYIMKSFQDHYSLGSSADLGLSLDYQFTDWLSADVILVNGEGYKKVQIEDGLLYGAGLTVKPLDGLTLRVYGSMNESADKNGKDCYNLATFVGYKHRLFSIGGEYNRVENAKFLDDNVYHGYSVYASASVCKSVSVFGRVDQLIALKSATAEKEELQVMGGLEFKLGKYIKLAPNFRYVDVAESGKKNYCMAYINCYFGI